MRTKEQEIEYVERTEKEVLEGMIYLIKEGHEDAVNRILEACKAETDKLKYGLEIARLEMISAREKLLKVIEEAKDYANPSEHNDR